MLTLNGFSISEGNSKIGYMPAFSVMPVLTCSPEACKFCAKGCYAMKCVRLYPNVKRVWENNTEMLKAGKFDLLIKDISDYILSRAEKSKPVKTFRFNVAGDIFNVSYLRAIVTLARMFPNVKFWTYTKQFAIVREYLREGNVMPENFTLLLSAWNGFQPPEDLRERFRVAHYDDGCHPELIPENGFRCPASGGKKDKSGIKCENCQMCALGKFDIVFHKH